MARSRVRRITERFNPGMVPRSAAPAPHRPPRGRALLAASAVAAGLAVGAVGVAPASVGSRASAAPIVSPVAATTPACEGATSSFGALGSTRAAAAVVCLVNAERAAAGMRPLKSEARLARAARGHASDMDSRDYFSHESPGGETFADRVTARGYSWSAVGENIAAGQTTPQAVVRAWVRSKGHCANIMSREYTEIGVGAVKGGPSPYGGPTWVQDFGRPRRAKAPGGPSVRCPRKPVA